MIMAHHGEEGNKGRRLMLFVSLKKKKIDFICFLLQSEGSLKVLLL